MQVLFAILTAIVAGVFANRRHASFIGWGALAAFAFLLIDSLLAVRLAGRCIETFASDEGAFLAVALLKCAFGGITVFGVNLVIELLMRRQRAFLASLRRFR